MNVDLKLNTLSLKPEQALDVGSDLWVIENNVNSIWWQKLDFYTQFLLTKTQLHKKTECAPELLRIIEATNLPVKQQNYSDQFILIGTENHFLNKWVLLYQNVEPASLVHEIIKLSDSLKFSSLRIFTDIQVLIDNLATRPTASSLNISFIENT